MSYSVRNNGAGCVAPPAGSRKDEAIIELIQRRETGNADVNTNPALGQLLGVDPSDPKTFTIAILKFKESRQIATADEIKQLDGLTGRKRADNGKADNCKVDNDKALLAKVESHSFLKRGAKGAEVGDLRKRLAAKGFKSKDPPNQFGPDTERAVRDFQKSMNKTARNGHKSFSVDGKVGDETWGALLGLTGAKKLKPGRAHVDKNADAWKPPKVVAPQADPIYRASDQQTQINVLMALANSSQSDKLKPEDAYRIAAQLQSGTTPDISKEILADLGRRALEALSTGAPKADYAYPGAQATGGQLYAAMSPTLDSAMSADPSVYLMSLERGE